MKSSHLLLCLGLMLPVLACGRAPTSELKLDIDIPKDKIDPADIAELLDGFDVFVQEGASQVALADFVEKINVEGSFKSTLNQIVAARDKTASVECAGRRCRIVTTGSEFSFTLSSVSIPVLGAPTVILGKRIEIFAELSADNQRFNACRISGVKVKSSFLTPDVDGALIELSGNSLKTIKVDAGAGGTYPNDSCR